MQPQPITVIIRSNQTQQFQETTGLLYITKQGENTFYTAIVEKENINNAGYQILDNNKSPLQFILEQQEKTRKKAELIADRIIEEIILQKSKQQMQQKLIKEQSNELQKLTEDLQQNLDTRSMTGFNRQPSISSLDFNLKRSSSYNQFPHMNQFVQKKNLLIQQIDNQIEKNIKEEQNNQPSYDNISVSSKLTPRGGSPKLNQLRNLNKSRNQLSPDKKLTLNKVMSNLEDRLETDMSTTSNNQIPLLNLQQNNGNQFDLKEYMKQAVLQGKVPKKTSQNMPTNHDVSEQTPAFNLNKKSRTVSQFASSLSHLDEMFGGGESGKSQFQKQKQDENTTSSQGNSLRPPSNRAAEQQVYYNNLDSFSVHNPLSDNVSVVSNTIGANQNSMNNHGQTHKISKSFSTRLSLAKRNEERDKLKMAHHAEEENNKQQQQQQSQQQLQLQQQKISNEPKKQSNSNVLEINFEDLQAGSKVTQQKETKTIKKSDKENVQQPASGPGQINDFIAKINMMLQKSANINAQVEQSMIDSEKNLQQLESLNNLTISK